MDVIEIYHKIKIYVVAFLGVLLISLFFYPSTQSIIIYQSCITKDLCVFESKNEKLYDLCKYIPGSILLSSSSDLSTPTTTSNSSNS